MINESGNGLYMPVAPAYGGGYGNGMMDGGWSWWIIILLIFGGWGNGFNGFGGNNGYSEVQRGFDQNAIMNGLAGLQTSITNGFQNAEVAACNRQMADMNQDFAMQSAIQNGICENRQVTADLKYTMATEAANTRANCDANNQKVLDKLCQLEMDGIKQNYESQLRALQNQINAMGAENQSLRFAASQGAQTAAILANNEAQTTALEQYLAPTPRPAYVVQNPNCCQQNFGCGCGNM